MTKTPQAGTSEKAAAKQKRRKCNMIHIEERLFKGEQNATTLKQLSKNTGISTRELSTIMQWRRREGVPICATKKYPYGYFNPANRQELINYLDRVDSEIKQLCITKNTLKKYLETMPE